MADMTGITTRRSAAGALRYRGEVWDNAAGRRITKTFPTAAAARNWRRDVEVKVRNGTLRASVPTTVQEAWEQWITAARAGVIRTRGGGTYKPGVLRSYELSWTGRLQSKFGRGKVGDLRRVAVQRYVDQLVGEGLAAQTVRNTITALRVLLKWCVREELISVNPCVGLELPAGGGTRDRIEDPSGALRLVQTLERADDRALMAVAFFAGLRRGEIMALRWEDVDLLNHRITVDHERGSYDPKTRTYGPPKSKKGARTLGIPELLVPFLACLTTRDQQVETVDGRLGYSVEFSPHQASQLAEYEEGLVFPRADGSPFSDTALRDRCVPQWVDAGLEPIGLHEARHTYASLMIAAGVNIKTISEWMGHSSVTITLDRYGHLLPGSAAEALGLLNTYLERELAA